MSGPRYHRTREQDQRLLAFKCQSCGYVSFPDEKRTCKRCGDAPATFEEVQLAERGEIKTFVVKSISPTISRYHSHQPIVDLPQEDGSGESARVYGLLTETDLDELSVRDRGRRPVLRTVRRR